MHVVTTGVHYRHALPGAVSSGDLTGIGKAGRFLNWHRIQGSAEHPCWSVPVAKQTDYARLAHPTRHFIAGGTQVVRGYTRRPLFLHREFRVRVDVLVDRLEFCKEAIQIFKK